MAPWRGPALERVHHLLVVARHEEREERVKVMMLELMVVLFSGRDGF